MKNNYLKIDIYFFLYLFLITFFSVVTQYLFKQLEKNRENRENKENKNVDLTKFTNINNLYLGSGLLMYTLLGFSIYKLLPYGSLIVLNIIWHLVYFIVLFIMGYLIYNEKYNFQKIIALILGFISLSIFMISGID